MLLSLLDPTAVFCTLCIFIPLYKEPTTTDADRVAFLVDPAFWGPLLLIFAAAALVRVQGTVAMDAGRRRRARWYLWNAGVFHIMMDGLVGSFGQLPIFYEQYSKLDKRFGTGKVTVPVVVGMMEVFFWAPLCLATYYCIRRGHVAAAPLELLTLWSHIVGAIIFVLPEYLEGYPNIVTDPNFEFTLHHLTYFWFGFFANFLWIFLPLAMMREPFKQCCGMAKAGHVKTE